MTREVLKQINKMQDQSELQPNTANNTLNAIKRQKRKEEYFEGKVNGEAAKKANKGTF